MVVVIAIIIESLTSHEKALLANEATLVVKTLVVKTLVVKTLVVKTLEGTARQ